MGDLLLFLLLETPVPTHGLTVFEKFGRGGHIEKPFGPAAELPKRAPQFRQILSADSIEPPGQWSRTSSRLPGKSSTRSENPPRSESSRLACAPGNLRKAVA